MERDDHLLVAEGFLDLGMTGDAWEELDKINPNERAQPAVLSMRLRILESMEQWDMGAEIAQGAVRAYPEHGELYLLGAVHFRRAKGIEEGLSFLTSGAVLLERDARYWFMRACLLCQLGRLEETTECTRRAVDLDRGYQIRVLEEHDLMPLRHSWEG